jgi:DNA adenine methylase
VIHRTEDLCRFIATVSLTVDEWKKHREIVRSAGNSDLFELGCSIFYLNRCNRSGVLSAGLIGGLDQTGNYKMGARFSRNDLIMRIELISLFKEQISISNLDAEDYINNYIPNLPIADTLVYLDPPYYNKSKDLYLNWYKREDHLNLSISIQNKIEHNWILSYDGVQEILSLYENKRHFLYNLQYSASRVYKGQEIFVFCDKLKLPMSSRLKHVDEGIKSYMVSSVLS